ncbi:MAG TPA: PPE family protein [Mycobacterium sp.]|nr:PPE family protein [Mycobacterium sp.]
MEFWALPPEITSAKIYSGPGSQPMTVAASAWSALAAELKSAAAAYRSIIGQLTGEEWLGPASTSMAAAVQPYVTWMELTAEQAEQAAGQGRAAAAAYETAHAMTVPPTSVTANRVLMQQLVATNVIGQNAPAIATTEAVHQEMWAQDAIAMSGYHAQSAAATELADFTPPPNPTNPAGEVAQAAAVSTADSNAAGTQATTASSTLQGLVNSLSAPSTADAATAPNMAQQLLDDPTYNLANQAMNQVVTNSNLQSNNICAVWRGVSGVTGLQRLATDMTKDAAKAVQGAAGGAAGAASGAAGAASGAANAASGLGSVAGGLGQAGSIGALSVPPSWAPPAPPVTALGPVSGGTWQPIGPSAGSGILGPAPMAPPAGMPGMPGLPAAGVAGAGWRGFGAPRYGVPLTVMPRGPIGG